MFFLKNLSKTVLLSIALLTKASSLGSVTEESHYYLWELILFPIYTP